MDAIKPPCPLSLEFSHETETEDVANNPADLSADAAVAIFESIPFSDDSVARTESDTARQPPNLLPALSEEEKEKLRQLAEASPATPLDRVDDLAAAFFIIAIERTRGSATKLANALYDAFSGPLNDDKTAMMEAFDIAMKKEMLSFIKMTFIPEAYQPQAASIIDNYIGELVSRRDGIRLGAANAEFLLASSLGDEDHAARVRGDIDAMKQGRYHSQREMSQALSIADSACSAVDMLDQFEMMLRNSDCCAHTLDTELQHLSLLADHWEDFVQKYARLTLKKH
ncbi:MULTISPECIES: hypothetical protein [unclassified Brenneria]|uniref:hypothetical protein n=1 Tax=unclassified Brenneria TaxID=2634434 RepID=UPI0018F07F80|nr:hypothetical protein [Brenneria sp. L3-3C-1]MBJ7220967.1 hypothetical protein [Brenneria sp. L3-3C-1]MEE3642208.1 hypothetical protein [Brenneria sp. L3_3C_1]